MNTEGKRRLTLHLHCKLKPLIKTKIGLKFFKLTILLQYFLSLKSYFSILFITTKDSVFCISYFYI